METQTPTLEITLLTMETQTRTRNNTAQHGTDAGIALGVLNSAC